MNRRAPDRREDDPEHHAVNHRLETQLLELRAVQIRADEEERHDHHVLRELLEEVSRFDRPRNPGHQRRRDQEAGDEPRNLEPDLPLPENAPVKDGKYIPITAEDLEIALDMADMGEITQKIFAAIGSGNKKEIHAKEKETGKKNGKEAM